MRYIEPPRHPSRCAGFYGASGRYNTISSTPFLLTIRAAYASEDRIKSSRNQRERCVGGHGMHCLIRNCPIEIAGEGKLIGILPCAGVPGASRRPRFDSTATVVGCG